VQGHRDECARDEFCVGCLLRGDRRYAEGTCQADHRQNCGGFHEGVLHRARGERRPDHELHRHMHIVERRGHAVEVRDQEPDHGHSPQRGQDVHLHGSGYKQSRGGSALAAILTSDRLAVRGCRVVPTG
jgi:hypothetical protein